MDACLCCAKNLPVSEKKACPLCGHSLMGHGWAGLDFHWKVRHEAEMPYSQFWAGLCQPHRDLHPNRAGTTNPAEWLRPHLPALAVPDSEPGEESSQQVS
jgi:hypothetical protein